VTHEHGKTVGWQFVQGRDFSREIASDSSGIVINEAAMKHMNLENPVGEPVRWTWWRGNEVLNYKILGVIKNMVMESPYDPIEPTIFFIKGHNGGVNYINIKIKPDVSASVALPKIEAVFKKIIPSAPFDYQFVDEEYAKKFASEERIGKLATFFAVLAIFISCLGLFGLASFIAEQRTKEIGIRKVLGASVANLWQLLSKDFVVLVVVSCLISAPIAYSFMSNWLQKYTYRTEISWWIFAGSAAGALAITLLTVSYQAIRAALLDPVKSLKRD
jgi:ABC-type antimicrobial peptide transport system permease subunit